MSETLRIAPADATKHTAQDAPGTTIGTWGDLPVYLISGSCMINEVFSASTIIEPFRDIKEGVDADAPVDAQNAPTVTWKTADSFPQAPTPILFLAGRKKNGRATGKNSATQLSTKSDQVQLPNGTIDVALRPPDTPRVRHALEAFLRELNAATPKMFGTGPVLHFRVTCSLGLN